MAKVQDVTGLLRELIAIPSVNPEGDPGTEQVGEAQLAAYLGDLLQGWGATTQLREVKPGRPNLMASWPKAKRRGGSQPLRVALAPHLDTVSVKGMTVSPFTPTLKRGRLYGRGASDTKGPMAAMLWAAQLWHQRPAAERSGLELSFAGLMGEEHGNEGAIAWRKDGVKADLVLVGEPTSMQVVHAHKGALWFELHTRGHACHASTPEKGQNAIYRLGEVLRRVEKKLLPKVRRYRHPLLGPASLSVGTIAGGQKVNIVPDAAHLVADVRTVPELTPKVLKGLVQEIMADLDQPPQFKLLRDNPALDVAPDHPLVATVAEVAQGLAVAPWFCDASVVVSPSCPAVAIGPGTIAQAHTKDEYIRVRDLEQGVRGFLRIFEALAAQRA